jgi:succinyl-CoA synthetase beta subunit
MESRLRRSDRDSQDRGDVGQGEIEVVMEDDDSPELGLEPEEAALDLVAVGDSGRVIGRDRAAQRNVVKLDLDPVTPQSAGLVDARANEESMQPGIEAIRVAERGQIAPGPDERVLHGVGGLFRIPEDQPGGGIQPGDRGACQLGEGVMIAVPRSLHEVSLHHAPRRVAGRSAALSEYGEATRAERSIFVRGATIDAPTAAPRGSRSRVKIQEADAKSLLVAQGLPVPPWSVAHSPAEAGDAAERFLDDGAERVVVKAQVLVGGRGKAGGVRLAGSRAEAESVAGAILGLEIKGMPVRKVLVGPAADIVKEFYLAAVLDRGSRRIIVMGSAEGGVEIEHVAAERPDAIVTIPAHPLAGFLPFKARQMAFRLGLTTHYRELVEIATGLVRTMVANDADLVEINPLAVVRVAGDDGTPVERLQCLDAKITLDDSALARHPGLEDLRDPDDEDPADREAREAGLTFIKLDGTIGCMVNGAGLAMTTMDLVKRAGGEPANFLDIGGGARADKVAHAMRLILADPKVNAILVNIFGGITRGDEVARGLIEARSQQDRAVPMVVRIVGTNAAEAAVLLREARFETATTLDEAAARAVAASRGAAA